MEPRLQGKRIAILATEGFEPSELTEPRRLLQEAGAETLVISPKSGSIRGFDGKQWGEEVAVDADLAGADPASFDALVLPGGTLNPDKLRLEPEAVDFVRRFNDQGLTIGAICHGPWLLVEADVVRGREVTSWRSLRTDLENAGAKWVDQEVATDQGLVTSRQPDDIPAFVAKLIEEIGEGRHQRRTMVSSAN